MNVFMQSLAISLLLIINLISTEILAGSLVDEQQKNTPIMNNEKAQAKTHVRAGQAKALRAIDQAKYQKTAIKTVFIEIKEFTDNKGLQYLAGEISQADIARYLRQMKTILVDKFDRFREYQSNRDHGLFHMTIVNPIEYQTLADPAKILGYKIRIHLYGLGRVSKGDNTAYFVIADSNDGRFIRQKHLLAPKDFHVTLGFNEQDVHGVDKNKDTLISQ